MISTGLSIVMTVLMRFLSGLIVYVILVVVVLASIGGTLLLWYIWYSKKTSYESKIVHCYFY